MSQTCETMEVDIDGVKTIINKEDFDADIHTEYTEEPQAPKAGTKDTIKAKLKELGVEFDDTAKKDELQQLLDDKLAEQE